jgi:hypothetical protein
MLLIVPDSESIPELGCGAQLWAYPGGWLRQSRSTTRSCARSTGRRRVLCPPERVLHLPSGMVPELEPAPRSGYQ